MPFSTIEDALEDLRAGKMVILTDDEDRENEGDLVMAAEFMTPEAVTFMLRHAMGYLCLSLTEEDCDRLNLHPQGSANTSVRGTAFTVSIDLSPKYGGTTGVSAKERAKCIRMAIDRRYGEADFVRPGHINPLRSRDGGVLVRTGQTEGSIDLCRLAGLYPAAAIIEVMRPDGEMARLPDLEVFAKEHNLKIVSVAQIIAHRLERESLVRPIPASRGARIETDSGAWDVTLFESVVDPLPHLVLSMGLPTPFDASPQPQPPTLVRMHRRHLLGDVFGEFAAGGPPSGDVLRNSMRMIAREGRGAIVYLRTTRSHAHPGAEVEDLLQTLRGTRARDVNTPDFSAAASASGPMPLREYGVGGQVLRTMGLTNLRLITTSNTTLPGLDAFGITISERIRPGE